MSGRLRIVLLVAAASACRSMPDDAFLETGAAGAPAEVEPSHSGTDCDFLPRIDLLQSATLVDGTREVGYTPVEVTVQTPDVRARRSRAAGSPSSAP
jgi:hypothetical protein